MREKTQGPADADGTDVTISLGIASLEFAVEAPSEDTEPLLFEASLKADQMLYEAKHAGRNCVKLG